MQKPLPPLNPGPTSNFQLDFDGCQAFDNPNDNADDPVEMIEE
jgi:hypothetical protein